MIPLWCCGEHAEIPSSWSASQRMRSGAPGLFVRFTRDERGRVEGMRVSAGERVRRIRFDRQAQ